MATTVPAPASPAPNPAAQRSPQPFPTGLRADNDTAAWVGKPLVRVTQSWPGHDWTYDVQASPRAETHSYQFEHAYAANEPLFERVGTDRDAAIRRAHERALTSFVNDGKPDEHQSQAVLQAASGLYYITGLNRNEYVPINIDGKTAPGDPASYRVEPLSPDLRAVVGVDTWIPFDQRDDVL